MQIRLRVALALVLCSLFSGSSAWTAEEPHAHAAWTEVPPILDGVLDDPAWQRAEPISHFTQTQPIEGGPPSFRTEVRILTTAESLFIAVRAFDPQPAEIVANLMGRDERLSVDDNFGFVFDTFHNHRNGFFIQVNPNGGRRDGTFEGESFEANWDGIWAAKARIDELGWAAEIEIPFRTFSILPGSDVWGFNMARKIPRLGEISRWADPTVQRRFLNVSHAGVLTGLSRASQGLGLDVVPSLSVGGYHDEIENDGDVEVEPSLDAFYRLLPSLTASLTVNTDFAQTEADNQEINLSRFDLFFPEKRDFFLEDGGLFGFGGLNDRDNDGVLPDQNGIPFFSRRIGLAADGDEVRLPVGGKLAGRVGGFNIGVLNVQQDRSKTSHATNLTVARVSANLLEESNAGVIFTHGDPLTNDKNALAGVDFNYRNSTLIDDRVVLGSLWFQESFSGDDDYGEKEHAWGAKLAYPNDTVHWELEYRELTDEFDPALGFVNRLNIRRYDFDWRYRIRPSQGPLKTIDTRVVSTVVMDRIDDDQLESVNFNVTPIKLTNHIDDSVEFTFFYLYDKIDEPFFIVPHVGLRRGKYGAPSGRVRFSSSPNRPLSLGLTIGAGGIYDGWVVRFGPFVEWRPTPHWLLSIDYDERRFRNYRAHNDTESGPSETTRTVDFETRTARVRVRINFNPDISWSTFVQYDNASNQISAQSIFRWIMGEGNDLYLVLGQDLDATPHQDLRFGRTEAVAKLSWTFRF